MSMKSPDRSLSVMESRAVPPRRLAHVPPAAFPVGLSDLLMGMRAAWRSEEILDALQKEFNARVGSQHCFLMVSGRAALSLALISIHQDYSSKKVVIPAYSCSTVLQSVQAAGLEAVFVDVDPETLDFNRPQLEEKLSANPLAVIGVHLYGLGQDFSELAAACQEQEVIFIEDAAQAYGARVNGRPVGTQGDFGIFSLGQGKCLPAGSGGVLLTNRRFAEKVSERINKLGGGGRDPGLKGLVKMFGYKALVNPLGWWLVSRSWLNPANHGADFDRLPDIRFQRLGAAQAGIAHAMISRAEIAYTQWRTNAERLRTALGEFEFLRIPRTEASSQPVYLRFPIVVDSAARAERVFRKLNKAGIGVSKSYNFTLPELGDKEEGSSSEFFPGAAQLAACLLTLPSNHYLEEKDIDRIKMVFLSEGN